ncbi:hypothetical protein [Bradyrhizobium arachidis]|jgi:hypothetical protein|uniref:Uncharacterized protein n=1 Tax=Bradyrhizobium arachidis TaxID=858423 RepID=A0AAE7NNS1_9BRAD|nr:hypothetical protein [Bradyrhizobium arachidis]QOZ69313.1 hypothetical protein WN72_25600 [Bradyrhizobium arachidis]SFV11824.1 hypothetical protein SAMN05192541_117152 [Bradyrhizobium arachidis]
MLVLSPEVHRILRRARLYGYLIERNDQIYQLTAFHPVCTKAFALLMVEGGWLTKNGDRYELTTQGREVPTEFRRQSNRQ